MTPETPNALPARPAPPRPPRQRQLAIALAVAAVVSTTAVVVLASGKPDTKPAAAGLPSATDTASASSTTSAALEAAPTTTDPEPSPSTVDPTTPQPSDSGPAGGPTPPTALISLSDLSSEMSSLQAGIGHIDMGTCLSGQLPDSTTAVAVGDDVKEVPCFAGEAHYKVIQTFPGTADLSKCDQNPDTQFEFSSEETTNGGITSTEYVYCLIGLGSYAR
jgi:hypothetical protein